MPYSAAAVTRPAADRECVSAGATTVRKLERLQAAVRHDNPTAGGHPRSRLVSDAAARLAETGSDALGRAVVFFCVGSPLAGCGGRGRVLGWDSGGARTLAGAARTRLVAAVRDLRRSAVTGTLTLTLAPTLARSKLPGVRWPADCGVTMVRLRSCAPGHCRQRADRTDRTATYPPPQLCPENCRPMLRSPGRRLMDGAPQARS